MVIEFAQAALSPWRAYELSRPQRRAWGYHRDPEEACMFYGRHPEVKKLIWC